MEGSKTLLGCGGKERGKEKEGRGQREGDRGREGGRENCNNKKIFEGMMVKNFPNLVNDVKLIDSR
jgi:hypothetical protein